MAVAITSPLQMRDVQMQTFSLPPEILTASAEDRYPVLPSAALAVRDITTYKCPQLNARSFASTADAEYKLTDAFMDALACVCRHVRVITDASSNARTTRMHSNVLMPRTHLCAFTETFLSTHLYCTACAYNRFLITLPGKRREGRGEQLAVTPVPRTSSGPVRQLKLDVCMLLVSSNSYRNPQLSKCYLLTFTLVFSVTFVKLAR